jgi:hypothetical protein
MIACAGHTLSMQYTTTAQLKVEHSAQTTFRFSSFRYRAACHIQTHGIVWRYAKCRYGERRDALAQFLGRQTLPEMSNFW